VVSGYKGVRKHFEMSHRVTDEHVTDAQMKSRVAEKIAALHTEEGLKTVLDGIGEGFYAVDRDWRLILFNGEASEHFRCTPESVLGRVLWDVFPGTRDTALGQLFFSTMTSRKTVRSEAESIIFKGRWMAYRLFPLGEGIGVVFRDTTDRRRAEEQRDLLIRELGHRVKNMLATVQSIAAQTFRNNGVDPRLQQAFESRLVTLSKVHSVLTRQNWEGADLHDVVWSALHNAADSTHFQVDGPVIRLASNGAVAFSMAVHELCTNAIKYGALATPAGRVTVNWEVAGDRLIWHWRESGGPPVETPTRRGFGSRMIERALATQLNGTVVIAYRRAGVLCTIDAPAAALRDGDTARALTDAAR
jgi:two-component sensor histidine kinase